MLVPIHSTPGLTQVDTRIFELRYFGACMSCTFCQDSCCQYGCDVNALEHAKLMAAPASLEQVVGVPKSEWFEPGFKDDPDYPSGKFTRSKVRDGRCVFLNRKGRGCSIHTWALQNGVDYHNIKPTVCWLFPITWDRGLLRPSYDILEEGDLVCQKQGPVIYDSSKDEMAHVWGAALIVELDALRATLLSQGHIQPIGIEATQSKPVISLPAP